MAEINIGDVLWQMKGREQNGIVKFHATPHCIEILDNHKFLLENGCGGSLGLIGNSYFTDRQECINSYLAKHGNLEVKMEDVEDLKNNISHRERTDFQNYEVVDFDSVNKTSVYVGGLSDLVLFTDSLNWHKEFVEGLDMEVGTLTLTEIWEQIKAVYGCRKIITVFEDSLLHGNIFQCGNYEDGKWIKLGTTRGYA